MGTRFRLLALAATAMVLAGCGKIFPPGERLLPATYGPPFGSALKDNQPHHPHHPASAERHAQADSAQSRTYRSHAACHAALTRAVATHGPHGRVTRVSEVESIGHYELSGEVHEQRCTDYSMSIRSWCAGDAGQGGGHDTGHKRAAPSACGAASSSH